LRMRLVVYARAIGGLRSVEYRKRGTYETAGQVDLERIILRAVRRLTRECQLPAISSADRLVRR